MAYTERLKLYSKIEKERKRPLIVYVTSSRHNASAHMGSDVIPQFTKILNAISHKEKKIDILIVSNGGDPTVSWRIISLFRERFDEVGVLIPYAAFSAATLLALGADEIIMHPFANLGPVDPQLSIRKEGDKKEDIHFGAEDLRHYIDFVRSDVGISDQEQLERAFELVCKEVGSIPIGIAKRSINLAMSMGTKLLSLHMDDDNKVKAITETLNKSYFHHGYPLGRKEAIDIGLKIADSNKKIEELIWKVWEDIEAEMECNNPFNPVNIIMSDSEISELIGPVPLAQIPPNLPPDLLNQAYQNILSQITIVQVNPIDYELFQASLECAQRRSEYRTKGKITATRLPDMNVAVNVMPTSQRWINFDN